MIVYNSDREEFYLEIKYNKLMGKKQIIHWLAIHLPDSCPFQRKIVILGFYLFTFPSLCKLNPFYYEVMEEKLKILGYDQEGVS